MKIDFINLKTWGLVSAGLSIYSSVLAGLYQWGFWLKFNVNPFQYASLSEVTTSIIILVVQIFIIVFLSTFLTYLVLISTQKRPFLMLLFSLLIISGAVVGDFFYRTKVGDSNALSLKMYILCTLPSLQLATALIYLPIIKSIIPKIIYRALICLCFAILPCFSFFSGWQTSELIKQGSLYSYVPNDYVIPSLKKLSNNNGLKYLGKIGSHVFFLPFDEDALIITSEETILPLVLMEHEFKENSRREAINKN